MKAHHIPPGRPQANGLVEVFNRIMDAAHGGERSRLMPAVIEYNGMPSGKYGASPWTVLHALRPLTSRWRNASLQEVIFRKRPDVTEEQRLHFLDELVAVDLGPEPLRKATDTLQEKGGPIKEAKESQQLRTDMAIRLRYCHHQAASSEIMLLTGDRVICKSTQYVFKTGNNKFETTAEGVTENRVVSVKWSCRIDVPDAISKSGSVWGRWRISGRDFGEAQGPQGAPTVPGTLGSRAGPNVLA